MQTQTLHQIQIEPANDEETLSTVAVVLWLVLAGMALDIASRWLN